jgi:prepilin-type processing-associated H-X9-DG protein
LPAIQAARATARAANCKSNMRQIGLAVLQYCDTHDGDFPDWWHAKRAEGDAEGMISWIYTIADHLENVDEIRLCPEDFLLPERLHMSGTSYLINDYLVKRRQPDGVASNVLGTVRNLNKLNATSRTIVAFEGADLRDADPSIDPHKYDAVKEEFVYAHPRFEHAHASQWFSQWNRDWGQVLTAVKKDIQIDRHFDAANYLYADGHVEVILATQIEQWVDEYFDFARPE